MFRATDWTTGPSGRLAGRAAAFLRLRRAIRASLFAMIRLRPAAMVMAIGLVAGAHPVCAQTTTTTATAPVKNVPAPAIEVPMPSWASVFSDLPRDIRALPIHFNDRVITHAASSSDDLDPPLEAGAVLGSGWVQFGGAIAAFSIGKL